jgi:Domain of unknown function (DUF4062)
MARIYVSSTFNDLKEFREHVRLQLRQMGHEDIAMEYYVAENQRPLDKCLKNVASCDLYIGIFAQRYGYIPPEQQKSITELEYRTAFDKGKDRLIFLLDEEASWPTKFVDKGKDAEKISSLRNELSRENLVSFFKDPHELKSLIATAVHNWEKKDGVISQKKEAEELDIGSYQKAIESVQEYLQINETISIPSKKFKFYRFTISSERGHVTGYFNSYSNGPIQDSGIQVLILDEKEFPNWQNKIIFPGIEYYRNNLKAVYYNSLYTISKKLDIFLQQGEYVIIFTNDEGSGRPSNYDKNVEIKIDIVAVTIPRT